MSRKFCWTDKAVEYVLNKIESYPDYVFAETELTRLSQSGFSILKELKFLKWKQFDWEHELFVSHLPGDVGMVRYLKQKKDKYWAYPQDDHDKGRIEVDERDLPHYVFDVQSFSERINSENDLDQKVNSVSDYFWFVGSTDIFGDRVGVCLILVDSKGDLKRELLAVPENIGKYARYIVLTPCCELACAITKSKIDKIKVSHFTLGESLGEDFRFKDGLLFSETKENLPRKIRILGFTRGSGRLRRHCVEVDGREGSLTEDSFVVLLRLVLAFKTEKNKRAEIVKLKEEGIFNQDDSHATKIARLKSLMTQEFSGIDFSRAFLNHQGSYQLVVSEVQYDLKELKKINSATIASIVEQLP